jgi:hypothetical protein
MRGRLLVDVVSNVGALTGIEVPTAMAAAPANEGERGRFGK